MQYSEEVHELTGLSEVLQSGLCVVQDGVGNGSVHQDRVIQLLRQTPRVASDSLANNII